MLELLTVAALVLAQGSPGPVPHSPDDSVLAIDGRPVPRAAYTAWLVANRGEAYLELYAKHRKVAEAAREAGLAPGAERVEARIEDEVTRRVEQAFGGDRAGWRRELESAGRSVEGFLARRRLEVAFELALQAFVEGRRDPSPEEVRAEWERRYGRDGRKPDVTLLRVAIDYPRIPPEADREARERLIAEARAAAVAEAAALRERALAGEDFDELVRVHSDGDPRTRGAFTPGIWPEEVRDAVHALVHGEVSAPLVGRGAANLFRVKSVEHTPFEDVEAEVRRALVERPASSAEIQQLFDALGANGAGEADVDELTAECGPGAWRGDAAVARLGETPVTRAELGEWLLAMTGEALLPLYVDGVLIEEEAARLGLVVTDEDVAQRVEEDIALRIERIHKGKVERWLAELENRGRTEAQFRREESRKARLALLTTGLLARDREIPDDAVRGLWHERYGFDGTSFDVCLIAMSPRPFEGAGGDDPERVRAHLEAERARIREVLADVRRRVLAGEDFATLARRHSDHPSKESGGRLEEGLKPNTWPPAVESAVRALEPGGVTGPLALGHGSVLFQLLAERHVPFEDVRAELRAELVARPPSAAELTGFAARLAREHEWRALPGMYR